MSEVSAAAGLSEAVPLSASALLGGFLRARENSPEGAISGKLGLESERTHAQGSRSSLQQFPEGQGWEMDQATEMHM